MRSSDFLGARNSFRQIVDNGLLPRNKFRYLFSPVGRRVALDREPSRFAADYLARKRRNFPNNFSLPTRCGRGPSPVRSLALASEIHKCIFPQPDTLRECNAKQIPDAKLGATQRAAVPFAPGFVAQSLQIHFDICSSRAPRQDRKTLAAKHQPFRRQNTRCARTGVIRLHFKGAIAGAHQTSRLLFVARG